MRISRMEIICLAVICIIVVVSYSYVSGLVSGRTAEVEWSSYLGSGIMLKHILPILVILVIIILLPMNRIRYKKVLSFLQLTRWSGKG